MYYNILDITFNTDGGVTASGFILLEAGDFGELGLTPIGKKHILRTWKELTSKSLSMHTQIILYYLTIICI